MPGSSFYSTLSYSTTFTPGRTPFKLLFARTIRMTIDLFLPQVQRRFRFTLWSVRIYDRTVCKRFFNKIQEVLVRQYLSPRKWANGKIIRLSGPLSYDVKVGDRI